VPHFYFWLFNFLILQVPHMIHYMHDEYSHNH